MKLIFLDIDGVFNSLAWYEKRNHARWNEECEFDPDMVKLFNQIITKTNARIVVSSTWRKGDLGYLQDLFERIGINGQVVGETARLDCILNSHHVTIPRGLEISEYLKCVHNFHGYTWTDKEPEETGLDSYVIIDDDSDMLYNQRDHFVQTSFKTGLTQEQVDLAVEILNR